LQTGKPTGAMFSFENLLKYPRYQSPNYANECQGEHGQREAVEKVSFLMFLGYNPFCAVRAQGIGANSQFNHQPHELHEQIRLVSLVWADLCCG
jgi:hypothetical protein